MVLVFSCSLSADSRSRVLAEASRRRLEDLGEPFRYVDLRDVALPLCDGRTSYGDPNAKMLSEYGRETDAILVAAPVYNYGVSAAAKNLVELTGRSWTGKVVGLMLAAGGQRSYMSGMSLANSLMLDFRCLVIPRYVYTDGEGVDDARINDPEIESRIDELVGEVVRVSRALKAPA